MDKTMSKSGNGGRKGALILVGVIAFSAAGITAGSAIATSLPPIAAPKGVSAAGGVDSTPMPSPEYAKNARGFTYGSASQATAPETEPDLISAAATNGKVGYVYKKSLDAASGTGFSSPEEALAWQAAHDGVTQTVGVYAVDGITVIGTFSITPSTGFMVSPSDVPWSDPE